jgi:hypothetical protein
MKGIVERFEGESVVLELNGVTKNYPRDMFPEQVKINDVVELKSKRFIIRKNETKKLRKENKEDAGNNILED